MGARASTRGSITGSRTGRTETNRSSKGLVAAGTDGRSSVHAQVKPSGSPAANHSVFYTTPGATPASKRGEPMTDRTPVEITNLDRYGSAALPWSRPHDLLAASATSNTTFFLGTVRPDGRPHAAGIGALWLDGDLYLTSGPQTRKARNLAANPACTISVRLEGIDLILEGEATRVTDQPTLAE